MKKPIIVSYRPGSGSAKALADRLGAQLKNKSLATKVFRLDGVPCVILWGKYPGVYSIPGLFANKVCNWILSTQHANAILNKAKFFQSHQTVLGKYFPAWTTDRNQAIKMLSKGKVVCRTKLTGHSGEGIVIAEKPDQILDNALLFTQYVKKKEEYRVHFIKDMAASSKSDIGESKFNLFFQRKVVKNGVKPLSTEIRNTSNGYTFAHTPEVVGQIPAPVLDALEKFLHHVTVLDFGALDIIYNAHYNAAYILEVNTAPGLEGATLDFYVENFKDNIEFRKSQMLSANKAKLVSNF